MSAGLAKRADAWRRAKTKERDAIGALYAEIADAAAAGMSEAEICRATGINRITVRRAMGK